MRRAVLFLAVLALVIVGAGASLALTQEKPSSQDASNEKLVAGVWEGEASSPYGSATFTLYLKQDGNVVTGTFDFVSLTSSSRDNKILGEWQGSALFLARPDRAFSGFELRYTEGGKLTGVYSARAGQRYTLTFTRKK